MRWVLNAARAAVIVIVAYFMLLWGSDAVRAFASSVYGLDEFGQSRDVFSIANALGLHGYALFRIAAFLAAFKLVGAVAFALHLLGRARALVLRVPPEHDMLDAALLLVVLLYIAASLPAAMQHSALLLRFYGFNLLLASAAALLNGIERLVAARIATRAGAAAPADATALERAMDEARAELPPAAVRGEPRRFAVPLAAFARRWRSDVGAILSSQRPL